MNFPSALRTAAILGGMVMAAPVSAQVAVYTDGSAFSSATANPSTSTFPINNIGDLGSSYVFGPATYSAADLYGYNDAYGVPYLGADGAVSVTTNASAIGFDFGSYFGPQTITYSVDGVTGTFDVPGDRSTTAFLGFTGLSGLTTLSFSNDAELDTTQIISAAGAVPEPATWAMMLVGFGAIGAAMRRRKTATAQLA